VAEGKMTTPQLTVLYRLEPGCLGPEGKAFIEEFCQFAMPLIAAQTASYMVWQLVPRYDKTLAEIEYSMSGKRLSESQGERVLAMYGASADAIVEQLNDQMTWLIDQFFGRF
jgi:hypothetical protein